MSDKSELLPCPFCGQQDAFVEQLDSDASVVICQGRIDKYSACLARGPVGVQESDTEDQPGKDAAIREWNRRAALSQQQAPAAMPDGWKLVPVKPTIEMVEAGYETSLGQPDRSGHARAIEMFDAMLAAAPAAPAPAAISAPTFHPQEPDWSTSETLLSEAWKNPLIPMADRLQIADGAIAWRNQVISKLRAQLAEVAAPATVEQDPIGWWDSLGTQPIRWADGILRGSFPDGTPIYTDPPAAEQPRMWMAKDERAIRELLAAINHDGGQHQHNVGIAQAARDALEEFDRIRQELAEQPESARSILTDDDMRRLRRFQEICEDSDACGHDLPKEAVKRLERAGALRSCGFGRHEVTLFGDYLLGKEVE